MKTKYQMTTVYKYAQLLENDSHKSDKSVKNALDRYLQKVRKANMNADLLEELLG